MLNSCNVRIVSESDLPMLLEWRNHPKVRHLMITQHEIILEEHLNWFARASRDPTLCLLIIENLKQPIGFAQFSHVGGEGVANWGFYASPDAPKGTGYKLCSAALDYAFEKLRLHKVCGQAIEGNDASIRLHKRLGFSEEGLLRNQIRMSAEYLNLHCFGLFAHEWQSVKLKKDAYAKD